MDYQAIITEFRKKHDIQDIKEFIHGVDHDADHEEGEEWAKFLKDFYFLLLKLFPDCDPYKNGE